MSDRVRIGTCAGPGEVSLIRAVMEAHEIAVSISGENNINLLNGLNGGLLDMDIWVPAEEVDEARTLLASIRAEQATVVEPGDEPADPALDDAAEDDADEPEPQLAMERRKRTGAAVVLACLVTFGTGHFYSRAPFRGLILAGIEAFGILRALHGQPQLGAALMALAIAVDLVGSVIRVRRASSVLPVARLRKPT